MYNPDLIEELIDMEVKYGELAEELGLPVSVVENVMFLYEEEV